MLVQSDTKISGKNVIVSSLYEVFKTSEDVDDRLLWHWFKSPDFQKLIMQLQEGGVRLYFYYDKLCMGEVSLFLCLRNSAKSESCLIPLTTFITPSSTTAIFAFTSGYFSDCPTDTPFYTFSWEQRKVRQSVYVIAENRLGLNDEFGAQNQGMEMCSSETEILDVSK